MDRNSSNYYEGCASDGWYSNSYKLHYLHKIWLRTPGGAEACGPFFKGSAAQDTTMPPLMPVGYAYHDKVYSSSYKGFRIAKGNDFISFYLYYLTNLASYDYKYINAEGVVTSSRRSFNNFSAVLNAFRIIGRELVQTSTSIRNILKEITTSLLNVSSVDRRWQQPIQFDVEQIARCKDPLKRKEKREPDLLDVLITGLIGKRDEYEPATYSQCSELEKLNIIYKTLFDEGKAYQVMNY